MPKRKSQFSEELQQKYPFFRKGMYDFEAECITCGYGTFVSVANKERLSLDMHVDCSKHKKAVRGEVSSAKELTISVSLEHKLKIMLLLLKLSCHFTCKASSQLQV